MNKCLYCGEEENYVPLVIKPLRFTYNGNEQRFIYIGKANESEWICLKCLDFEINAIKDV